MLRKTRTVHGNTVLVPGDTKHACILLADLFAKECYYDMRSPSKNKT